MSLQHSEVTETCVVITNLNETSDDALDKIIQKVNLTEAHVLLLQGKKSFAWKYFGVLQDSQLNSLDSIHVYCSLCFNNGVKLKRYKRNCSTTNFLQHLKAEHDIFPVSDETGMTILRGKKRLSDSALPRKRGRPKKVKEIVESGPNPTELIYDDVAKTETYSTLPCLGGEKTTKRQHRLGRRCVLWFCRDLLPFSAMKHSGFKDFMRSYGLIGCNEEFSNDVLLTMLRQIYDSELVLVQEKLKRCPQTVTLTLESWNDSFRQVSCCTYVLHWIGKNFEMNSVNLHTGVLYQLQAEALSSQLSFVFEKFNLNSKKVIVVTNGDSIVIEACNLAQVKRISCIAHDLQNLVTSEALLKNDAVSHVTTKVKRLVKSLAIKLAELFEEEEEDDEHKDNLNINKLHEEAEVVRNVIEADEQFCSSTVNPGFQLYSNNTMTPVFVFQNERSTVLTMENTIQWHSTLMMLEYLLNNKEKIIYCLEKLKLGDYMLGDADWMIVEDVAIMLLSIRSATEMLSGEKYATTNLTLLFRAELESTLQPAMEDSPTILTLKNSMRQTLNDRMPISDVAVCAALLDPALRHLKPIAYFLENENESHQSFLKKMYECYVLEKAAEMLPNNDLDNLAQILAVKKGELQIQPSWKRKKLELSAKHSARPTPTGIDSEIAKFLSVSENVDDVTAWWNANQFGFPELSKLAQAILIVPATSGPCERVFSTTGSLMIKIRSSLSPVTINKILFLHDNFDSLTSSSEVNVVV